MRSVLFPRDNSSGGCQSLEGKSEMAIYVINYWHAADWHVNWSPWCLQLMSVLVDSCRIPLWFHADTALTLRTLLHQDACLFSSADAAWARQQVVCLPSLSPVFSLYPFLALCRPSLFTVLRADLKLLVFLEALLCVCVWMFFSLTFHILLNQLNFFSGSSLVLWLQLLCQFGQTDVMVL